jgi:hypothetical protein
MGWSRFARRLLCDAGHAIIVQENGINLPMGISLPTSLCQPELWPGVSEGRDVMRLKWSFLVPAASLALAVAICAAEGRRAWPAPPAFDESEQEPEPAPAPKTVQTPSPPQPAYGPLEVELGLVPPSPQVLFRTESEAAFLERLRVEGLQKKITLSFPKDSNPPLPPMPVLVRSLPSPQVAAYVPSLVCHSPLYFEARNTERYGWYVPGLQPVLSAGKFYLDTLLLPERLVTSPPWTRQCETDEPAPGDPVPFVWRMAH